MPNAHFIRVIEGSSVGDQLHIERLLVLAGILRPNTLPIDLQVYVGKVEHVKDGRDMPASLGIECPIQHHLFYFHEFEQGDQPNPTVGYGDTLVVGGIYILTNQLPVGLIRLCVNGAPGDDAGNRQSGSYQVSYQKTQVTISLKTVLFFRLIAA